MIFNGIHIKTKINSVFLFLIEIEGKKTCTAIPMSLGRKTSTSQMSPCLDFGKGERGALRTIKPLENLVDVKIIFLKTANI